MENIKITATDNSPDVDFNFDSNVFSLRGMSFMENVHGFYEDLFAALDQHLAGLEGADVKFTFALEYFNSSSARTILHLMEKVDNAAANGNTARIIWDAGDDEDIAEEGEELAEDLEHAVFEVVTDDD